MNNLLGRKIRVLRESRNLTQEQIAGILGISRQKYARIENGANNITLDILTKISDVLEIKVSDITNVLDKEPDTEYRMGAGDASSVEMIYDMLDLFYANKHVYDRMHYSDSE